MRHPRCGPREIGTLVIFNNQRREMSVCISTVDWRENSRHVWFCFFQLSHILLLAEGFVVRLMFSGSLRRTRKSTTIIQFTHTVYVKITLFIFVCIKCTGHRRVSYTLFSQAPLLFPS